MERLKIFILIRSINGTKAISVLVNPDKTTQKSACSHGPHFCCTLESMEFLLQVK